MPNDIQRAILAQLDHEEREARTLWENHLESLNPTAMRDHARQKAIDTAWNIAAFFALVLFLGWLASLKA